MEAVVSKAIGGASMLAGVQLASRVMTFGLNVLLARSMDDPSALGLAGVQLYLLNTVVLALAREGLRRAGMRSTGHQAARFLRQLAWVAVGVGTLMTPILCTYFIYNVDVASLGGVTREDYVVSIKLVGLSIVLELLSEPMFVSAQSRLDYKLRSKLEALAVMAKCVVQFTGVVYFDLNLCAFALGHTAYGFVLLVGYSYDSQSSHPAVDGNDAETQGFEKSELVSLVLNLSLQQVWKLVLQEGEKLVMMGFSMGAADQAVYSLVSNLGSLVVRFVFLPVEESAFAVYGKLNDMMRSANLSKNDDKSDKLVLGNLVSLMCKCMSLIGLTFVSFGPFYSHLLLFLLYGPKWSNKTDAPAVLGVYCAYVCIIAYNGTTEAFVHAVGSKEMVKQFNFWLLVFSGIYIIAAIALFHLGAVGLICANCISMSLRIAFSLRFILSWKDPLDGRRIQLKGVFPGLGSLLCFCLSAMFGALSERFIYRDFVSWRGAFIHILVGSLCLLSTGVFILRVGEPQLVSGIRSLRTLLKNSSKKSE